MRKFSCFVLLSCLLLLPTLVAQAQPQQPFQLAQSADGQPEFVAAGTDVAKLKAVAARYPDSVWGKLAAARVKIIERQQGIVTPDPATRQIEVVPKDPPAVATEPPAPAAPAPPAVAVNPDPPAAAVEAPPASPPPATDPPTSEILKVAQDGSARFTSIVDAVNAAQPYARIEVAPGTYEGGAIIDKPLEVVGTGSFDQVIWQVTGTDLIQWRAASGLLKNMTLLQNGGCEKTCNVIYFDNGSATIENSSLTGLGGATIYVQGVRSAPRIVKNNLHNAKESAIYFELAAGGEAILNDILGSGYAGIEIKTDAHPLIRGNKVHGGKQSGIYANTDAKGLIVDNEIYDNVFSGFEVREGANPVLRNNVIRNNGDHGIFVNSKSAGLYVQNSILANGKSNVAITTEADPVFISNTIRGGSDTGVLIDDGGKGRLENNFILESALAGVEIRGGSRTLLRRNTIRDGKQSGVFVHERATATLEDNDIISNSFSALEVTDRGTVNATNNRFTGNAEYAVYVHNKGGGTFKDNDFGNNARGSTRIEKTAGKVSRSGNRE